MKINSLLIVLLAGLLYSPIAFSQDETSTEEEAKTFTISGSVDTYFHKTFGAASYSQPGSSFANINGFGLGMANLIASYNGEKVGFVADLVFGPRGYDAVFNNPYTAAFDTDNTGQRIVNQLYAYIKLSDAVTLNLGQFNTFLGYEVISPTVNVNYSTSYLFSYGPFNHTGLRADFDLGGGLGAKLAIMNPTDMVEGNFVDSYTLGAQIGYTNDNGGVWLNVLSGDQDGEGPAESTFQIDLTTGWDVSDAFYIGLNASTQKTGDGSFTGAAVYPKFTLSDAFALGLRAEYFMIKEGYNGILPTDAEGDGSVIDVTLSGNYTVGNLTIIPEIRIDKTSEDAWNNEDGDSPTDMLTSFTLAAVYKF